MKIAINIDVEPKEIAELTKELQGQQKIKNNPKIQEIVNKQLKELERASIHEDDDAANIALAFAALFPYC